MCDRHGQEGLWVWTETTGRKYVFVVVSWKVASICTDTTALYVVCLFFVVMFRIAIWHWRPCLSHKISTLYSVSNTIINLIYNQTPCVLHIFKTLKQLSLLKPYVHVMCRTTSWSFYLCTSTFKQLINIIFQSLDLDV